MGLRWDGAERRKGDRLGSMTIGPLVPGTYVIEFPQQLTAESAAAIQERLLERHGADFKFLLLGDGARIARITESEARALDGNR